MNQSSNYQSVTQTVTIPKPPDRSTNPPDHPTPSKPCTREQAERKPSRSSSGCHSTSSSSARKEDDSGLEQTFGRRRHGWDESTGFDEPEPEQTKEKETSQPMIGFSLIRSSSSSDKSQKTKPKAAIAKKQRPPTRKEYLRYIDVQMGINPIGKVQF